MKVSKNCLLVFASGTRIAQAGWLLLGIAIAAAVYRNNPDIVSSQIEFASSSFLVILAVTFLWRGFEKGRHYAAALEAGKQASGRALKVEADNSGDETEYNVSIEYRGSLGEARVFPAKRNRGDLAAGDAVSVVFDEKKSTVLLEPDLPCGVNFSNVFGAQPLPRKCFLRIAIIPALAPLSLLGLLPGAPGLIHQSTVATGFPILAMLPVVLQIVWLFANRKHFTVGEPWELVCS